MSELGERLTDDEVRELFLSPMTSVTETRAAMVLRFEVTRARREEAVLRARVATLEAALRGLVDESDPETLRMMEKMLRAAGRTAEAEACSALAGGGE